MFVGMLAVLKGADPTLILAVILLFTVWFLKPAIRNTWMIRNIPGPRGVPILCNGFAMFGLNNEQMHNKFCEMNKTYGPVIAFEILSKIVVTISNPVDAQIIMMNPKIRNRDPIFEVVSKTFIDNSFLTLRDHEWTARRKLVNTAFRLQIVVTYLETFTRKADELANKLAAVADGRSVDILSDMMLCTLSGFCETALGYKNEMDGETTKTLLKNFELTMGFVASRLVNPFHWPLWLYNLTKAGKAAKKCSQEIFTFIDGFIDVLWEAHKRLDSKGSTVSVSGERKLQTFTDVVIENSLQEGTSIHSTQIRSDVMILAAGGTESCASTMSLLLMLIGIHPDYQERLVEEQLALFGDSLRPVRNEDILEMPLLQICIKETLRLFPPIPFVPRNMPFDLPISNGNVLPAGTMAIVNAFNIHRSPLYYEDPEKFWPERWLPENSVGRHTHAYIPYGSGGRHCVAIKYSQFQMKATLSRLLRQFHFSCDYTMDDLNRLEYAILNKPLVGHKVRIAPRTEA